MIQKQTLLITLFLLKVYFCLGQEFSQEEQISEWLSSCELNNFLKLSYIEEDKKRNINIHLILDDDELTKEAWSQRQKEFYTSTGYRLEEYLIDIITFIVSDSLNTTIIHIDSYNGKSVVIIRYLKNRLSVKYHWEDLPMGNGTLVIKTIDFKEKFLVRSDTILNVNLVKTRQAVSKWLLNYYQSKGTPILYKARVDTSKTYYNEFIYDITHLSNEILKDENYFEYIRIKFKFEKINDNVHIRYMILGKYGSGIGIPPKRKNYKFMEPKYSSELSDYETFIIEKIKIAILKL